MRKARIDLLIIFLLLIGAISAYAEDDGFKSIFNGKDLSGWDGDPQFWSVEDGAITGRTTEASPAKENTFIFWRQGELDDFELRLSFRLINGNSGIQIRSREIKKWVAGGYQADMESSGGWTGALYDEQGRGPLATRGQKTVINEKGEKQSESIGDAAELLAVVKKDDWNEYAVIARGPHFVEKINGRVMSEAIDNDAKSLRSGKLALQIHVGPPMTVQFKDIRLKRLPLQDKKKIVMVAGKRSHGHGEHEHNAGVLLLKSCLDQLPYTINADYHDGWPSDPTAFDNANSIMLFMDGGAGHPMIQGDGLRQIGEGIKRAVGLAVIHYAVEVPSDRGGAEFLKWIGGYYETGVSTNPIWTADFKSLPDHPVTRGVKPFVIRDEWYFNIHFRPDMKSVVPLLKAVPPDDVRRTESAKAHPGREEIVSWCVEHPDGGRGFGFTGGHYHKNWGDDNYRKLVLNALYWTAHVEVPLDGVPSTVTPEQLGMNLDNDREQ